MTSLISFPSSLLEEKFISPTVAAEDAQRFFEQHGIFYAPDPDIGKLVATLGSEAVHGKVRMERFPIRDSRLRAIIGPFTESFCFTLGPDPKSFYASTITDKTDHRIIVYMWGRGSHCEFSGGSHIGELKGAPASNGLVQVPYSWLKKRNLPDRTIKFEDGGIMILHPRLCFQILDGHAIGWGCQKDITLEQQLGCARNPGKHFQEDPCHSPE